LFAVNGTHAGASAAVSAGTTSFKCSGLILNQATFTAHFGRTMRLSFAFRDWLMANVERDPG
jgi:hypothetical protein